MISTSVSRGDVLRQILVGQHDHLGHAEALDDLAGVARGAADVALGLHRGRGVDVGHDRHAGPALAQQPHVGGGDRGGERAAGAQVGDQHALGGIEELGGLGHEVDAGQHDHLGIDLHGFAGERQAVADDVGHAVEDLRRLVVVGEDDGVALALERGGWRRYRARTPTIRPAGSRTSPVHRAGRLAGRRSWSTFMLILSIILC